jgi:alcohol dehydrogenase class IV
MINNQLSEFPIVYVNGSRLGKIAVGWGCHTTVGDECKEAGIKNALIVTTGLKETGIVDEIKSILNYHGVATAIYDKVTSNPKDYQIMEGYQVFKDAGCDGVVSVGGGSSHDCGKAIRVVDANGGKHISEFTLKRDKPSELMKKYKSVKKLQISVNTTAGTGAENSGAGAFTNTSRQVWLKEISVVPGIPCYTSLSDPLLIRCQPSRLAAGTAFDTFTHATEGYVSRIHSEVSKAVAYRAVKLIAENIREFANNRMNQVACENICWANTLGSSLGLNTGAGAGLTHGLSHGVSATCDIHHGLANMVMIIPTQRYNQPVCPDRFAELAEAMGVDMRGLSKMQASDKWFEEVEGMLKDLNVEIGHLNKQFGFNKENCGYLVKEQYGNDMCSIGNPRDYNFEEITKLFESLV